MCQLGVLNEYTELTFTPGILASSATHPLPKHQCRDEGCLLA